MQWLSLLFKPKKTMNLCSDECDIASYLFDRSRDGLVILIPLYIFCKKKINIVSVI